MSLTCNKYTITNGCGHLCATTYRYCGRDHDDSWNDNASCFGSSREGEGDKIMSVCMGTSFCNKGCRAMCMGWKCCTCGYKVVEGFLHQGIGMLVHASPTGRLHAFCAMCEDIDTPGSPVTNRNVTNDTTTSIYLTTNDNNEPNSDYFEDAVSDMNEHIDTDEHLSDAMKIIRLMDLAEYVHEYANTPMDIVPTAPMEKTKYMTEVPNREPTPAI
jgi:hypothetical protein